MEYLKLADSLGIPVNEMALDYKIWEKDYNKYEAEIRRLGFLIEVAQ